MLEPAKSQGYLVINYPQYENMARWEIEIYKNTGVDTLDYKLEETIVKRNTTYHHFDSTYFLVPGQYQYTVKLYGNNNQLLALQGNTNMSFDDPLKCDGCGTFNKLCVHKCVGSDHAYELQRWFHPNNGSLSLSCE
ncbi:MAG: hypothetical protein HUU48_06485 [Flavobacteriales bacterium]|nr:hypothetical protein [Flavobacteriales bacterium]